jgi:hypothetical protein
MNIHQLQATYQVEQDRILLRLNTRTHEEFRVWLTRRMVKNIYPHLLQVSQRMGADTAQPVHHDGDQPQDLASFQHQDSIAQADFQTSFSETAAEHPVGAAPLLVSQIKITQVDDHTLHLALEEKTADADATRAFEVSLGLPIIHALLHLLDLVLKGADWGIVTATVPVHLPGNPPDDKPTLDAFDAAERPVYLN